MRLLPVLAAAASLAGCHGKSAPAPDDARTTPVPTSSASAQPVPPAVDAPGGFAPLQSAEVKDAIHRALLTGQDQRWQDGAWSGYAVPSRATMAHGCRTVRYTIDQQPDAPVATINACDAGQR